MFISHEETFGRKIYSILNSWESLCLTDNNIKQRLESCSQRRPKQTVLDFVEILTEAYLGKAKEKALFVGESIRNLLLFRILLLLFHTRFQQFLESLNYHQLYEQIPIRNHTKQQYRVQFSFKICFNYFLFFKRILKNLQLKRFPYRRCRLCFRQVSVYHSPTINNINYFLINNINQP